MTIMWAYHSTRDGNGGADTGDSLSFAQHTSKGSFVANILATLKDGVIDAKNQGGGVVTMTMMVKTMTPKMTMKRKMMMAARRTRKARRVERRERKVARRTRRTKMTDSITCFDLCVLWFGSLFER